MGKQLSAGQQEKVRKAVESNSQMKKMKEEQKSESVDTVPSLKALTIPAACDGRSQFQDSDIERLLNTKSSHHWAVLEVREGV